MVQTELAMCLPLQLADYSSDSDTSNRKFEFLYQPKSFEAIAKLQPSFSNSDFSLETSLETSKESDATIQFYIEVWGGEENEIDEDFFQDEEKFWTTDEVESNNVDKICDPSVLSSLSS